MAQSFLLVSRCNAFCCRRSAEVRAFVGDRIQSLEQRIGDMDERHSRQLATLETSAREVLQIARNNRYSVACEKYQTEGGGRLTLQVVRVTVASTEDVDACSTSTAAPTHFW